MKQKLTVLFIGFSSYLSAQFGWIIHDPEIAWAAELIYTFDLTKGRSKAAEDLACTLSNPKISTLKAMNSKAFNQDNPLFSMLEAKQDFLLEAFLRFSAANPQRCYQDMYLQKNYPPEDIQKLLYDENGLFNSETVADTQTFYSFKIRQLFFYDRVKQVFETRLLAIAPMFRTDTQSEARPLFWFDPGYVEEEELQLNNPDVAMVKLMHFEVSNKEFSPLKTGSINEIIVEDAANNDLQVFLPSSSCLPLTTADIKSRAFIKETVPTYDPVTYEPSEMTIFRLFPPEEMTNTRLMQHFYFDPQNGRMAMRLVSIAPIQDQKEIRINTEGDTTYPGRKDLFYVPARPKRASSPKNLSASIQESILALFLGQRVEKGIDSLRNHSWQKEAYDKLLQNPDVSWAAELYYRFDLGYGEEENPGGSTAPDSDLPGARSAILKFQEPASADEARLDYYYKRPRLNRSLLKQGHSPERFYRDSRLKNWISAKALDFAQVDTTTTYSPDTYEIQVAIVRNEFDPASIVSYQIRQLFYYHQPTRAFRTQILAIAPIASIHSEGNNDWFDIEVFWFDPGRFEELELHRRNPAINIVKMMEIEAPMERFRLLKSPSGRGMEWLFEALKEKRLSAFDPASLNEKIQLEAIRQAETSLPKYKQGQENGQIEKTALRILQHLYIDLKSCRLGAKWISLTPTQLSTDAQGRLLESRPVFTIFAKTPDKQ